MQPNNVSGFAKVCVICFLSLHLHDFMHIHELAPLDTDGREYSPVSGMLNLVFKAVFG